MSPGSGGVRSERIAVLRADPDSRSGWRARGEPGPRGSAWRGSCAAPVDRRRAGDPDRGWSARSGRCADAEASTRRWPVPKLPMRGTWKRSRTARSRPSLKRLMRSRSGTSAFVRGGGSSRSLAATMRRASWLMTDAPFRPGIPRPRPALNPFGRRAYIPARRSAPGTCAAGRTSRRPAGARDTCAGRGAGG